MSSSFDGDIFNCVSQSELQKSVIRARLSRVIRIMNTRDELSLDCLQHVLQIAAFHKCRDRIQRCADL